MKLQTVFSLLLVFTLSLTFVSADLVTGLDDDESLVVKLFRRTQDIVSALFGDVYTVYFNVSYSDVITYNLSASDDNIISTTTFGGQKEVWGPTFE